MSTLPALITIADPGGLHPREATDLAASLQAQGIAVAAHRLPGAMELRFTPAGLTLNQEGGESILVDFASDAFLYRLAKGGGRRQPMARAMGLKPGYSPLILDATAGLGRDGFLLAALGCRVILCERSPILCALLRDGLTRAAADPRLTAMVERITLQTGDSRHLLPALACNERPEVISLDPMFPFRRKSALVKKEMRLVRSLVGEDADTAALLQVALIHAGKRVVCKRPSQAPPLNGPEPDFAITTPKHRFDVYLRR